MVIHGSSPATYGCMKLENQILFLWGEAIMLQIRSQVISPPHPATFPTPLQTFKSPPNLQICNS